MSDDLWEQSPQQAPTARTSLPGLVLPCRTGPGALVRYSFRLQVAVLVDLDLLGDQTRALHQSAGFRYVQMLLTHRKQETTHSTFPEDWSKKSSGSEGSKRSGSRRSSSKKRCVSPWGPILELEMESSRFRCRIFLYSMWLNYCIWASLIPTQFPMSRSLSRTRSSRSGTGTSKKRSSSVQPRSTGSRTPMSPAPPKNSLELATISNIPEKQLPCNFLYLPFIWSLLHDMHNKQQKGCAKVKKKTVWNCATSFHEDLLRRGEVVAILPGRKAQTLMKGVDL